VYKWCTDIRTFGFSGVALLTSEADSFWETFSHKRAACEAGTAYVIIGVRTREVLVEAIGEALDAVSARDADDFFTHCG
jgi:hypothetical protein